MLRTLTAVGGALAALLTTSVCTAQTRGELGQHGQFIIDADRLFSFFSYTHLSQDELMAPGGNTKAVDTFNGTAISLLWGSAPVETSGGTLISPFAVPRLGLDYVIAPNITIGGDIVLFFTLGGNSAQDLTTNGATTSTSVDNPGQFLFGLAPRGGYILPINNLLSLWLRGGFSYFIETSKTTTGPTTTTSTLNQFALDLEPELVLTPLPHLGATVGLTGDFPLTGGHSTDQSANGTSQSASAFSSLLFFGITVGAIAYF